MSDDSITTDEIKLSHLFSCITMLTFSSFSFPRFVCFTACTISSSVFRKVLYKKQNKSSKHQNECMLTISSSVFRKIHNKKQKTKSQNIRMAVCLGKMHFISTQWWQSSQATHSIIAPKLLCVKLLECVLKPSTCS